MAGVVDKLKSGAVWGVAGQVGTGFLQIGNSSLLSRVMTIHDVGYYFFLLSMVRILMNLVAAGTHRGLLKEAGIAAHDQRWAAVWHVVKLSAFFIVGGTCMIWAVMIAAWPIFDIHAFEQQVAFTVWGLFLLYVFGRGLELIASSFFRAVGWATYGVLIINFPREVMFCVVLLVILFTAGTVPLTTVQMGYIGVLATLALINGVMFVRIRAKHPPKGPMGPVPTARSYAHLCVPAMLQGTASLVLANSGTWVLGFSRPPAEVALYGVALQLTNLISFLLIVVNLVLPPMVAVCYHKRQMKRLHFLVRTASTWTCLFSLCGVLFYGLAGPDLLHFVYGPKYVPAYDSLVILAIGQAVNASLGSPGIVLEMTGHQTLYLRLSMISVVIGVGASLLLVPDYGPIGAASSTVLAIVVQKVAMTICAYRYPGVYTLPGIKMFAPKRLVRLIYDVRKARAKRGPKMNTTA